MPGGLISIHGSILLFGTAGLFGKFLNFDAVLIVQGRTLIAFVALVLVHPRVANVISHQRILLLTVLPIHTNYTIFQVSPIRANLHH